jgi:hypothetical protein
MEKIQGEGGERKRERKEGVMRGERHTKRGRRRKDGMRKRQTGRERWNEEIQEEGGEGEGVMGERHKKRGRMKWFEGKKEREGEGGIDGEETDKTERDEMAKRWRRRKKKKKKR